MKPAYVTSPFDDSDTSARDFCKRIADTCFELIGVRAFVAHEDFDLVSGTDFTPEHIDAAVRNQICNNTSVLILLALWPSFDIGIELEMANQAGVPVILICKSDKIKRGKISRLLLGNPAATEVVEYETLDEALARLRTVLPGIIRESAV